MTEPLSYVHPTANSPWGTYLSQVDRVVPYLGHLARWAETLKAAQHSMSQPLSPSQPCCHHRGKWSHPRLAPAMRLERLQHDLELPLQRKCSRHGQI